MIWNPAAERMSQAARVALQLDRTLAVYATAAGTPRRA